MKSKKLIVIIFLVGLILIGFGVYKYIIKNNKSDNIIDTEMVNDYDNETDDNYDNIIDYNYTDDIEHNNYSDD